MLLLLLLSAATTTWAQSDPASPAPTATTSPEATAPPTSPPTTSPEASSPTTPLTAAPAPPQPPADGLSPEQRFQRGKRTFEYRDCPATIATLADLAIPGLLADEEEQLEVHRMLGICYALADQRRDATREFSSLLSLDPDHQLDPFEVPPPVMELFESQKTLMKARLDELRRARERQKDEFSDGGVLVERVTTVRTTPFAAAFLPLGLAQLANGDVVKAAAVGSAQGVGLLVNVVGYWGSKIAVDQGLADGLSQEEVDIHKAFYFTHIAGLGVALVAYGVGVADALWNREDQAVTASKATKRPLTPQEIKNLRRIERAPDPKAPAIPDPIEPTVPSDDVSDPPASTPGP